MKRCRAEAIQRHVPNQRRQSSYRGPRPPGAVLASQCRFPCSLALRHHRLLYPASTNVSNQVGPSARTCAPRPAQANTRYRESATYASCRRKMPALMYGVIRFGPQPIGRQPNKSFERTTLPATGFAAAKPAARKAAAQLQR